MTTAHAEAVKNIKNAAEGEDLLWPHGHNGYLGFGGGIQSAIRNPK